MIQSIRSALMVVAALSASQVAPAQVTNEAEPLIAHGSGVIPANVVLQPISPSSDLPQNYADPLAPALEPEPKTMVETDPLSADAAPESEVDREASLADKVAALRGSDPGSREMECLAVG